MFFTFLFNKNACFIKENYYLCGEYEEIIIHNINNVDTVCDELQSQSGQTSCFR